MGNRFSRSQKSSPHVPGGEQQAEQTDLIAGQTSAGRGRLSRLRRSLSFSRSRRFKRQTIAEGPVKSFIILQDDGKDRRRLGEVEAASLDQLLTECKTLYGHESSLITYNDQPITAAVFEDFTDTNVLTIHTGAPQEDQVGARLVMVHARAPSPPPLSPASESLTSPQTSSVQAPPAANQSRTEGELSTRTSEHTEQEPLPREPVDVPISSPPAEISQDELPQLPTDLSAARTLQRKEDKTPLSEELGNVEYSSSRRGEQGLVSTSLSASILTSSKQNSQISENKDVLVRTDDVSDTELRDIAKCVDVSKVPDLGLLLGFGYPEIERYQKTNFLHNNVTVDGTTHMLFTWREKTPGEKGRRHLLASKLDQIGMVQTADKCLRKENTDYSKGAHIEDEQFAEIFAKELRRYYKQIYCTVTTDPWDERQVDLNEYFISLSLRQEVDTRSRKKTKDKLKNSHNDLFNLWIDDSIADRILVFGEGGTGKSTLCKKLAYDWAKKVPQSPLKDVKILCALECRRLQGSGDVAEAIHTQLICKDSSITPDRIKRFIQSNPTEVKLILDGYDEFDPDSYKGDINDVLAGKMMAEVTTLVTTRPWHTCLLQKQTCMYAQVSLDGFDSEGIDSFVKQYFAPDDRAARQCLEKIKYSGVIRHLARVPILLSMVCYLKKTCSEDTTEADTMNSLFTKFLRALFVNNIDKIGESRKPLYHEIPDEVDMPVLEKFWDDLGEMALEGVLKPGKKLIFPRDEFGPKTRMIEIGLKIGLLVRQKAKIHHDAFESLKVVYSFPHLLFQEKCAGDFIASHPEVMESTLAGMSNAAQTISLQYTLVFSCQRRAREGSYDNRERSRKIVEHLVSLQDNEKTDADLHSELSGIDEQVPEFLDEMLVVKSHDFMRSLFLLSLMISHESGSEAELLPMIEKLNEHNPERQDYDGSLCHSFLYYLKFGLPNNVSFQPCTSLSMFDIIETISLSDLLSLTTKSYRKLKSIFVSDFTGDFSLEGLPGPSLETFKLEELSLNKCQKSVHLSGLMNILSQMKIDVNTISLTYTELDLHESCKTVRQSNEQQCSVQKLHINNISTQVSLYDLLHLFARKCQDMRCLHVSYVELVLHEHNPDLMPRVGSTAIEDLEIGFVDNQLSLSELLGVASSFCPAMKRFLLHDIVLTVEDRDDTSRKECVVKSCLEELRLQNMMEDISVTGVLDVVGQSLGKCHLTLLSLDELKAYIPSHTEIVPSADDVKTQLIVDEIRLRKVGNARVDVVKRKSNIALEEFSIVDIFFLIARYTPNTIKLHLLFMTIRIPEFRSSHYSSLPDKLGIEQVIIAGSSFPPQRCSLADVLAHVGMACPRLQRVGLSHWCENLPYNREVSIPEDVQNDSLAEFRLEFVDIGRGHSISIPTILSVISRMFPNLETLSLAKVVLGDLSEVEIEDIKTLRECRDKNDSQEPILVHSDGTPRVFSLRFIHVVDPINIGYVLFWARKCLGNVVLCLHFHNCCIMTYGQKPLGLVTNDNCCISFSNCRVTNPSVSIKDYISKSCPFLCLSDEDTDNSTLTFKSNAFDFPMVSPFFHDTKRLQGYVQESEQQ